MMRRRFQSLPIASKLRVVITAACVIVIFLTGLALMVAETLILRNRMVAALDARANVVSANAAAAVMFHSPHDAEEILRAGGTDEGVVAATIFDEHGAEFARYLATPAEPPIAPPGSPHQHVFTVNDVTVWTPMQTADHRAIGTLAVRRTLGTLYERLAIFGGVTVAVTLAAGALAWVLSHFLQRIFSAPVLTLARAAESVTGSRDFSARVPVAGTDELAQLAHAFNIMLGAVQASHAETKVLYAQLEAHARQLETRVQERTAELQAAYRELEAFSYSVSHDLRSPLRSINGFTEALLEDGENRLSTDSVQHARRVIAAVGRMNRLIDGLLDFSRLSKRELRAETIDLHALARDVVAELSADTARRNVEVSVAALSPCFGDPTLIRQVLVNLVSNAFKYSRERDPALISISEELIDGTGRRAYVVRDNGAGFDMQHAGRLFQVFERLHDARQFEGTGIGLATSKRIVERHGGRIWAEATPGKGAAFFFTLALPDTTAPALPVAALRAG
ncbi:MAG TPA: ATP-binding protein [Opitutaceae bacterium]|nr:ATP-binding protein [Opitutaceae bacterium]